MRNDSDQNRDGTRLNKWGESAKFNPQKLNDRMNQPKEELASRAAAVIRLLVNELVDAPEKVAIKPKVIGYAATQLEIEAPEVSDSDYGTLIGKGQRHLRAWASICRYVADSPNDLQLKLKERPPQAVNGSRKKKHIPIDDNFDKTRLEGVFQEAFDLLFDHETRVAIVCEKGGATAVEVIVSNAIVRDVTCVWLENELSAPIQVILSRNGRFPTTLVIKNDPFLYEQLSKFEAAVS
jgi:predicted RNA-binding protein YlqC (UPF0109 family)